MKVLIVDDSAVMRKIIIKALTAAGYTDIVESADGKDALAKSGDVDVIFTDWNMPVMDGLTFVKEFRKISQIPVIMLTTEGGQKEVLEAMKSGVSDYIVKPFTPAVLVSKLESLKKK